LLGNRPLIALEITQIAVPSGGEGWDEHEAHHQRPARSLAPAAGARDRRGDIGGRPVFLSAYDVAMRTIREDLEVRSRELAEALEQQAATSPDSHVSFLT
jgi:hypothetical protein